MIAQAKTGTGKVLYRRQEGGLGQVVEPGAVAAMNAMMRETFATGTARAGAIPGWDLAGKTGTSQDFRDAWFVGYSATLVAGVWLGNDDGEPTKRVSGGNLPVETWARFMKTALAAQRPGPLPGGSGGSGGRPSDPPTASLRPGPLAALPPRQPADSGWTPPSREDRGLLSRLLGN